LLEQIFGSFLRYTLSLNDEKRTAHDTTVLNKITGCEQGPPFQQIFLLHLQCHIMCLHVYLIHWQITHFYFKICQYKDNVCEIRLLIDFPSYTITSSNSEVIDTNFI